MLIFAIMKIMSSAGLSCLIYSVLKYSALSHVLAAMFQSMNMLDMLVGESNIECL